LVWLVVAAYAAVLCFYSLGSGALPGAGLSEALPGRDLAAHGLAYGGLAFMLCVALSQRRARWLRAAAMAFTLSAGYAGVLELAQAFVPARTASCADLFAGVLGGGAACALWVAGRSLCVACRRPCSALLR